MFWKRLKQAFAQPPSELVATHNAVMRAFTYVKQPGEWANGRVIKAHVSGPIVGDCDDFAASVAYSMRLTGHDKANFAIVLIPKVGWHAVCIYQDWVSDNRYPRVYPLSSLKGGVTRQFPIEKVAMKKHGYKLQIVRSGEVSDA